MEHHPTPTVPKTLPLRGWGALLLVACIVRWIGLGSEPFWLDEINSVLVTMGHGYPVSLPAEPLTAQQWIDSLLGWQPFSLQNTLAMLKTNVHLPLYYLLLHPWLTLFGLSEISLRAFAVVWSVLLLVPLILLAKQLPEKPETPWWQQPWIWVAVIAVSNPFQLIYAQEGRMYTLALFLTALSTLSLWRVAIRQSTQTHWWLAYVGSTLSGLFCHYVFWFQGIFHAAVWGWAVIRQANPKQPRWTLAHWGWLLSAIILFIASLGAWLPMLKLQQAAPTLSGGTHFSVGLLKPIRYLTMLFWEPWMVMTGSNLVAKLLYIPLTTVGVAASLCLGLQNKSTRTWISFVAAWAWLPLLALIASDLLRHTHTSTIIRYGMLMSLPILLLTSTGLVLLYQRSIAYNNTIANVVTTALFIIIFIVGLGTVLPHTSLHYRGKFPVRSMAGYASQQLGQDDLILSNGPLAAPLSLAHYLAKTRPQALIQYYVSPYREQAVSPPDAAALNNYDTLWLFRYRGGNERGLDTLLKAIRSGHPKGKKAGPRQRWVIYSRK